MIDGPTREPRLTPDQVYRSELIDIWRGCKGPGDDCWTSDHITGAMVEEDATKCAKSCTCWRHHVAEYRARNGIGA